MEEPTYRGHSIDEMLDMSLDEVADVLPARARRKLRRGLSEEERKLMERARELREEGGGDVVLRTHLRNMVILPEFVGLKFGVHDGSDFEVVEVMPEMVGHYLGEFALTRKRVTHSGPGIGATRSSKYVPLK
ncbi:MAG: 30S ribosomal protein S19 [Methanonatronarchaeales archaeon]|nr:30S ribosomal protein S19 [Methanonatronarchaeales archaeon]